MTVQAIETLQTPLTDSDTDPVPSLFTPWGDLLCYECHGRDLPNGEPSDEEWDELTSPTEPEGDDEAIGICSECSRDVVTGLQLAKFSRVAYEVDFLELTQTGGMVPGLDGETADGRYVQVVDDNASYREGEDGDYARAQVWDCGRDGYDRHYDHYDDFEATFKKYAFESENDAILRLLDSDVGDDEADTETPDPTLDEDEALALQDRLETEVVFEQGISIATRVYEIDEYDEIEGIDEGWAVQALFFDSEVPDGLEGWISDDDEAVEIDRIEWSSGESNVLIGKK